ncbi:MAG: dockerin type I repeat-containing protein [Candidatus Zixiibacteriota bacterium]
MMKNKTLLFLAYLCIGFAVVCSADDETPDPIPVNNYDTGPGIMLRWLAPGDDGRRFGTAKAYDIRYWPEPITGDTWKVAHQLSNEPKPVPGGCFQAMFVYGIDNIQNYYFAMKAVDDAGNWSALSYSVTGELSEYICGDVDGDGRINVGDEVYLIRFIFKQGPAPQPLAAADLNGNGYVEIGDLKYMINYIHIFGPPPICGD